ncbi:hypothetical protein D3C74_432560 [compost metagenome]
MVTSITTANMVSRAMVGLGSPVSITEEIITTSREMTDRVRIRVPKGSPNLMARASE